MWGGGCPLNRIYRGGAANELTVSANGRDEHQKCNVVSPYKTVLGLSAPPPYKPDVTKNRFGLSASPYKKTCWGLVAPSALPPLPTQTLPLKYHPPDTPIKKETQKSLF